MKVYKSWTNLKAIFTPKNLLLQYHEEPYRYLIFCTETDGVEYVTEVWKDTSKVEGIDVVQNDIDVQDFEDNYKANANQSLADESGAPVVNIEGGTVNAVSARFKPAFAHSKTGIILSDTEDTELTNLEFDGKVDALSFIFDKDDVEFVLELNGEEILRIELEDIPAIYGLDVSSSFFNFPIYTTSNGKQVMIRFASPPDITTNLKIKAKATTDSETKMISYLISYRIKVT